jgi:hypothetical protein
MLVFKLVPFNTLDNLVLFGVFLRFLESFKNVRHLHSKKIILKYLAQLSSLIFVIVSLLLVSCNQTFEPLKENNTSPFSIFGYLDASVDTQRIQISPLREQLDSFTDIPEMTVMIENLETGKSAVMNNSLHLFSFPTGINAPNAWTTMKIDYGQTYRVSAKRPDGAVSNVAVTIPDNFLTPRLLVTSTVIDKLYINDVESLVDVQSRWFFQIDYAGQRYNRLIIIPYRDQVEERGSDDYVLNHCCPVKI